MTRFLDVEILGVQSVRRQLFRGAERAGNMRPALLEIRADIFRVIRENFESEGARSGTPWKPISDEWLARKVTKGKDEGILRYTNRLFEAFTGRSRYGRSRVAKDRIVIDSTLPYSDVQQYGEPDRNIPARPFVRFLPSDRVRWVKMAEKSIMGAMRGD